MSLTLVSISVSCCSMLLAFRAIVAGLRCVVNGLQRKQSLKIHFNSKNFRDNEILTLRRQLVDDAGFPTLDTNSLFCL